MRVENQLAMDLPDIPHGVSCGHCHAEPSPALPGPDLVPFSVDIRNVYIATKLMHEFMEYAKVRARPAFVSHRCFPTLSLLSTATVELSHPDDGHDKSLLECHQACVEHITNSVSWRRPS